VLSAAKDGYHFQEVEGSNGAKFARKRLGGVAASVKDGAGAPISGVLLSLSGARAGAKRFSHNAATADDGSYTFPSLFPGSYFMRPLLKEYRFEPSSAEVTVEEGEQATAVFTAKRVAFSAFGRVRSLNGAPEAGLTVTATAAGKAPETATTDADGEFRVRGLQPGSTYEITVAEASSSGAGGAALERTEPESRSVTIAATGADDVRGLEFVGFRRKRRTFALTGTVDIEGDSALAEGLEVHVTVPGDRDHPIATRSLGFTRFFEFADLLGGEYEVSLSSPLSDAHWDVDADTKEVALGGRAGGVARTHVQLRFAPKERVDPGTEPVASIWLLLALLGGAAYAAQAAGYVDLSKKFQRAAPATVKDNMDFLSSDMRSAAASATAGKRRKR